MPSSDMHSLPRLAEPGQTGQQDFFILVLGEFPRKLGLLLVELSTIPPCSGAALQRLGVAP